VVDDAAIAKECGDLEPVSSQALREYAYRTLLPWPANGRCDLGIDDATMRNALYETWLAPAREARCGGAEGFLDPACITSDDLARYKASIHVVPRKDPEAYAPHYKLGKAPRFAYDANGDIVMKCRLAKHNLDKKGERIKGQECNAELAYSPCEAKKFNVYDCMGRLFRTPGNSCPNKGDRQWMLGKLPC
jgi:hypothetical protein